MKCNELCVNVLKNYILSMCCATSVYSYKHHIISCTIVYFLLEIHMTNQIVKHIIMTSDK